VLYIGTLTLLWQLVGRPVGPETDILALLRTGVGKAMSVLRRDKPQPEVSDAG